MHFKSIITVGVIAISASTIGALPLPADSGTGSQSIRDKEAIGATIIGAGMLGLAITVAAVGHRKVKVPPTVERNKMPALQKEISQLQPGHVSGGPPGHVGENPRHIAESSEGSEVGLLGDAVSPRTGPLSVNGRLGSPDSLTYSHGTTLPGSQRSSIDQGRGGAESTTSSLESRKRPSSFDSSQGSSVGVTDRGGTPSDSQRSSTEYHSVGESGSGSQRSSAEYHSTRENWSGSQRSSTDGNQGGDSSPPWTQEQEKELQERLGRLNKG